MSEANTGADFLQTKFQLNRDPGVEAATKRREQLTGEIIPQNDYSSRIQNYLDRLDNILNPPVLDGHPNFDRKQRNLRMLKRELHSEVVIKEQDVPDAHFESIKRRHRDEGRGNIELPESIRNTLTETIIKDQQKSLDKWVNFLTSNEAKKYPDWIKYFVFRSILHMGRFDKEKKSFTERTGGTIAPFPDLNHEALTILLEDIETQYTTVPKIEDQSRELQFTKKHEINSQSKLRYRDSLEKKNFAKLYALALEEFKPIPEELLKITEGKWRPFPRGSDPQPLVDSISEYGTGWCLRGVSMAELYLKGGEGFFANDLHIYYSLDKSGEPTIPRLCMVVNPDNKIDEMRGVAEGENLDPYIGKVAEAKLNEHPDGKRFKKKSENMFRLTAIDHKINPSRRRTKKEQEEPAQSLNKDDLTFLYEINAPIEGFGFNDESDPRIAELRKTRNPDEDIPIVFGCGREQIARNPDEINDKTVAYVGKLVNYDNRDKIIPVSQKLRHLEYIYTSFPERKKQIEPLEIGGKSVRQFENEFEHAGIQLTKDGLKILHSPDLITSPKPQQLQILRLQTQDLDFTGKPTYGQLYQRAIDIGLELCPPEVALHKRLKDIDQPLGEWYSIAMKQIAASVFRLTRHEGGTYLDAHNADPDRTCNPWDEFYFALPKDTTKFGLFKRLFRRRR